MGKTVLKGGKVQYHLYDGKNVIGNISAKVGDSVVVELPTLKIKKVLPLKEGVSIFLLKGKHGGDTGVLKQLKGTQAVYTKGAEQIETAKEYVFVVGEKASEMTL
jgi:ribosomal protein S4E